MNRKSKSAVVVIAGIALSLLMSAANSAVIDLRPDFTTAVQGSPSPFELFLDFGSEKVIGGAIDISFSSAVFSYDEHHFFDFDPSFQHDGGNLETKDAQSASLISIGFSNTFFGITGPAKVGTLFLNVKEDAPLFPPTEVAMTDSKKWLGFYDFNTFEPVHVNYDNARVAVSAVPLPPTAWLFASGLAVLGMFRLRRELGAAQAETNSSFA